MIFEPVCQELLIRSGITSGKGEGRIDDTKDSNYIIRLEHYMLTLFSAPCFKTSKTYNITLKGTDSKIFAKNGYGTIPSGRDGRPPSLSRISYYKYCNELP